MPRKKRKKTEREKLVDKLDDLARDYVKARDKYTCVRCGVVAEKKKNCHWSHIKPRQCKRLRWDANNAITMCYPCHRWWHENPTESGEWFKKEFPDTLKYLNKNYYSEKLSIEDLQEIKQKLEKKISKLSEEDSPYNLTN